MFNMMFICLHVCLFLFILKVGEAILDKPEGTDCMVNNQKGICINYQKCIALAVKLHNDYENTEVELCSFNGSTPIICCTGCDLNSNISNLVFTHTGQMRWRTEQISKEKCYTYSDAAFASDKCVSMDVYWSISWLHKHKKPCDSLLLSVPVAVGGRRTKRNEFPHMALLGYGERLISAKWRCGGSLISDRYILTAGHCTADAKLGAVKYVALGILRRSDPPHWWHRYEVKEIIPHHDYRSPSIYNDIALLKLKTSVKFGPSIFPACLPFPDLRGVVGRRSVTATGWGAMGSHMQEGAEILQVIKVEEFTEAECTKLYKNKRLLVNGYNHTTQMCYGDHYRAVDTCEGDSGGPLQIDSELCMYVVLGVTSSGTPCGNRGGAGLYTRVQHYLPWIEEIVWADEETTAVDIWLELVLKKIKDKPKRNVRSSVAPGLSSMEPDIAASSTKHDIVILKSVTELYSTEKPSNNPKDSYRNIINQNDWIAFLDRHKNEALLKKSNEWIGTEIPDLGSPSDKHTSSTSSSIKLDSTECNSTGSEIDYKSDYSSYSDEFSDSTNALDSPVSANTEPVAKTTESVLVSTEPDVKLGEYDQRIYDNSSQSFRSNLSNYELLFLTIFCGLFLR